MPINVNVVATSGAEANGVSTNSAHAVLKNNNELIDNKTLLFTLTGNAVFTDTMTNMTSRITSIIGTADVSFTNIVAETVVIRVDYLDDPSIHDADDSTFVGAIGELEAPVIQEAIGNIIDYSTIETSIHVIIPIWEGMKSGDIVHAYIGHLNKWDETHTVTANEVGKPIIFTINNAKDFLLPYIDNTLRAYYSVNERNSIASLYNVVRIFIKNVAIIGKRDSDRSALHLCAFNSVTKEPIAVRWQYHMDINFIDASRFTDCHPLKKLYISIPGQKGQIMLYPMNIASVGNQTDSVAFAITLDGKINFWGANISWALPPSNVMNLTTIMGIISSPNSVAVIDERNTLYSWGNNSVGGNLTAIVEGVSTASCNRSAICAIITQGYLKAWGNSNAGGEIPANLASISDFITLSAARGAFCALNSKGFVSSWGESNFGGEMPPEIQALNNIVDVVATDGAFAIRTNIGTVQAWGNRDYGGSMSAPVSDAIAIASSTKAFAVLHKNKSVSAWGSGLYGGIVPPEITILRNIIAISSSDGAFTALCEDGKLYTWGSKQYGGTIPANIANKDNIMVAATSGAFSFINKDGGAGGWGNNIIFPIVDDYFFRAVYRLTRNSPPDAFICIDIDGNLNSLGNSDTSTIPSGIHNMLGYSQLIL